MSVPTPRKINIRELPVRPYAKRGAPQWEAFNTSIGIVFCNPEAGPMILRDGKLAFLFDRGIERVEA
jgi:hypothetical protein